MSKHASLCNVLIQLHLRALRRDPKVSLTFWDLFLSYVLKDDKDLFVALSNHVFHVGDGSTLSRRLEFHAWAWLQHSGVLNLTKFDLSHRHITLSCPAKKE